MLAFIWASAVSVLFGLACFVLKKRYMRGLLKVVGPQKTPELYKYCHLGALSSGLYTDNLVKSRYELAALPRAPLPRRPKGSRKSSRPNNFYFPTCRNCVILRALMFWIF